MPSTNMAARGFRWISTCTFRTSDAGELVGKGGRCLSEGVYGFGDLVQGVHPSAFVGARDGMMSTGCPMRGLLQGVVQSYRG